MSEYTIVEQPFLRQLATLGWKTHDLGGGVPQDPTTSFRKAFSETALREIFRQSIHAINCLDDGRPWLTDAQLDELFEQVTTLRGRGLVEANEANHRLLLSNGDLKKPCGLRNNEMTPVKLIDFAHPERNSFVAINQFRVDPPGGGTKIRPDIVLFVNGMPVVVVECKDVDPNTSKPIHNAIEDLRVYANRRTEQGSYAEGDERLFLTNLFVVATCGTDARAGTFTAGATHFYSWRDITPADRALFVPPAPIVEPREQELLVQGMLAPDTLLDLMRHFTVFMDAGKARVKIVARYQQYRAVHKIIDRLRIKKTHTERSGVVWHTQGSGKSLTMVFAIRKLRTQDDLKDHRVLLVNDRQDLERQLTETARLSGEVPVVIDSVKDLDTLKNHASDLVLAMVHKFQEKKTTGVLNAVLPTSSAPPPTTANSATERVTVFPTINDSSRIIVMVDEAHRSQGSTLGENLIDAFPNATRIAFTGTPLKTSRHARQGTQTINRFGGYIDKYLFNEAIADRATLPIHYIGRTVAVELENKDEIDEKLLEEARKRVRAELANQNRAFPDLIKQMTDKTMDLIRQRYGGLGDIFEAEERIGDVAPEMVNHYVDEILPNGFKAQVVCNSKVAAARYKRAIDAHIATRLAQMEVDPDADAGLLARLRMLKSAVVLSTDGKQTNKEVKEALEQAKKDFGSVKARVSAFKKDFDPTRPETGLGILIVCDMLLTGFDAPIEQVMYLDKKLKEHNLLQTVARVNRVRPGKDCGYIVDFVGLMNHLEDAFQIYGDEKDEVGGALTPLAEELDNLEEGYQKLLGFFMERDLDEIQAFVEQTLPPARDQPVRDEAVLLLKEITDRAEFEVLLEDLLRSLNICYALQEARRFVIPARRFVEIQQAARKQYRDPALDVSWAGERVRGLVNTHLKSKGLEPEKIDIPVTDPSFLLQLKKQPSPVNAALEMEHALRVHLKSNLMQDPAHYEAVSRKLEEILKEMEEEWRQLKLKLVPPSADGWDVTPPSTPTPPAKTRTEVEKEAQAAIYQKVLDRLENEVLPSLAGPPPSPPGLTAEEAPFYRMLVATAFPQAPPDDELDERIKLAVHEIFQILRKSLRQADFWNKPDTLKATSSAIRDVLLRSRVRSFIPLRDKLVEDILALAKTRQTSIIAQEGE